MPPSTPFWFPKRQDNIRDQLGYYQIQASKTMEGPCSKVHIVPSELFVFNKVFVAK